MSTQILAAVTQARSESVEAERRLWLPEPSLESVLETSGSERSTLLSLVEVLVERGELDTVVALVQGLRIANPDNYFFHCLMGLLFDHLDRRDEALEAYSRAIEANPTDVDSYVHRGELRLARAELDAAKLDFLTAMELDPDGESSMTERAWALNASATRRLRARSA